MQKRCSQCVAWTRKHIYKSFTSLVLSVYAIFSLVLLILLFFVLLSLYLSLHKTTSNEIRDTLSKQADDNMLALSAQGTAALWENFFKVGELLRLTAEVVVSMQNEATFALAVRPSVSVDESCRTSPCADNFAYLTHNASFSRDWLDRTSRLEPLVKLMVSNTLVPIGLSAHFLDWGFSRYLPARLGLERNAVAEETWLNEWRARKSVEGVKVPLMVSSIDFSLDPVQATLMQDLVLGGKSVGVICARLGVDYYMQQAVKDMLYLGKGFIMNIYPNGVAVRGDLVPTNITEIGLEKEWKSLLEDPYLYSNTTHKVTYQGELYRMAIHPLGESLNDTSANWWFATALLVKEADILDLEDYSYQTEMALWMLLYPMLAATFILIAGAGLNWLLNDRKLRTPMNRITQAMKAMKEGEGQAAREILEKLGKDLHKSEVQRLVLGMFRLIKEVSERGNEVPSEGSVE